ncbi:MAG: flagellar hook-length control protein FliK [Pseudomonadota bacterium]
MPEMMPLVQANDGRPAAVATTSQKDSGYSGLFYDALAALLGVANGDAASSAPALPVLSQGEAPAPRQEASPDGNVLPPYAASVPVPVNPGVQNGMNVSADDNPGVTPDAAHMATMAMTAGSPSITSSPAGENPRALSDLSQPMLPVLASESAMSSANFASVLDDTPAGVTQVSLVSQPAIPAGSQVNSQSPAGHATAAMTLPLGAEGWGQELGDRVQWLVNQSVQTAELRINPPHLGPVEIRIAIDQDQASVSFTTQHSVTRDAIEAAIPRLRDMLGDSGLNLASINVSSQSQSFADQRGQQTVPQQYAEYMGGAGPLAADESSAGGRGVSAAGLVDYYA